MLEWTWSRTLGRADKKDEAELKRDKTTARDVNNTGGTVGEKGEKNHCQETYIKGCFILFDTQAALQQVCGEE